jgi:hypothetical protein
MSCNSCQARMKMEQEHDNGRTYGLPTKSPCPEENRTCSFFKYNHVLKCGCKYIPNEEFGRCIDCVDPIHRDFQL